ncbi:hypothetical protein [Dactylosporangium cerinum]
MRRRAVFAGAAAVVAAGATGGWWVRDRPAPAASTHQAATGSVAVVRADLSTTTRVTGALGFRDTYTVFAQGPGGTVTGLPGPARSSTAASRCTTSTAGRCACSTATTRRGGRSVPA